MNTDCKDHSCEYTEQNSNEYIDVSAIKNRLPSDFAEQIFNKSDALQQISNLKTQYNNESMFADDAENMLIAVRSIISDAKIIRRIDEVLSSRYKRYT